VNNGQAIDISYEPFSKEPEYIEGNRAFVRLLPFKSAERVLDLACGTGTISGLILEIQPRITILGLDISRESLILGQRDFLEKGLKIEDGFVLTGDHGGKRPKLVLVEGTADRLPFKDMWADIVFMGHSIHMLSDLDLLLQEIHRILVSGGIFAFNSSFYAGSQASGTDHFYQIWWKAALAYILEKDAKLKEQGLPGIKRKRGTAPKAFSSPWLSKEEWNALLKKHDFEVDNVYEREIMMTRSNLEKIGSYAGLAAVMVSGYPVKLASEALVSAVAPALEAAGMEGVPRFWLEVTARRK
jgi:ubiquinone/menaquinone biosynthesis C-methylase UbiE